MGTKARFPLSQVLSWIVLGHSGLFLAYWLTNNPFFASVNDFLEGLLNLQTDYVSLFLWISTLIGSWSALRLIFARPGPVQSTLAAQADLTYRIIGEVYIVFFYGGFWMLWNDSPIQAVRLGQMVWYHRTFLDLLVLLGVATSIGLAFRHRLYSHPAASEKDAAISSHWSSTSFIGGSGGVFILLWTALLLFPPGNVYRGDLPEKPLIIAHRGASMLAPENTLAAEDLAVDLGASGIETDIHLSQDGIPYLMHDATLQRTTNVAAIFPGRENAPSGEFRLAEIKHLNAGEWFVKTDPYQAIARGRIASVDLEKYRQQSVPTLGEVLKTIRDHRLIFIFDLETGGQTLDQDNQLFYTVLDQIHQAGIDSQTWFLADPQQLLVLRATAPQVMPAYGVDYKRPPAANSLTDKGYQVVNAEYGLSPDWIRRYQAAHLWVNLYTVDEPWEFSRAWLLGVNSVTTSNVQAMTDLQTPLFGFPYRLYIFLWIGCGLWGIGFIAGFSLVGRNKTV